MRASRKVGIVDDDNALRDSLSLLLRFRDYEVIEFQSGEAFLESGLNANLSCLIVDLKMPGIGGLEVLQTCQESGFMAPVIMVTAFGDASSARDTLKSGAFDFVEKPIDGDEMLQLIEKALSHFDRAVAVEEERQNLRECLTRLTPRERQILDAVLAGQHNREIAALLDLSVRTVEVYKARMMEKMRVSRYAELIKLFARFDPR
jgi:RNA polymerase sigma factor (sigma-70 family)